MQLNSRQCVIATTIVLLAACVWLPPLGAQDSNQAKWTATSSLTASRGYHTATLLPNGHVLIVGGYGGSEELACTELYEPNEGIFVPAANMAVGRTNHTATLLTNGEVLVVGGQSHGNTLASAELYNPATGVWTATGSLHLARSYHTATLLSNGQVLVAGGSRVASPPLFPQGAPGGSALDIAELYNPVSGKWTVTDNLHAARYLHTATLLANGQVLVTGGIGAKRPGKISSDDEDLPPSFKMIGWNGTGNIEASAELYNPRTGTWTGTGSLPTPLFAHAASLLSNGQVLVEGGKPTAESDSARAELYSPVNGVWTSTGSLHAERNAQAATLLSNGKVLVSGGANSSGVLTSTEIYNPSSGTWETVADLNNARSLQTATLLPNDRVLVTGGSSALGSPTYVQASAELYGSVTETTQGSTQKPVLTEAVHATPTAFDAAIPSLITLTICLVILTACVVILLAAGLIFVLIERWRK